jgi:ribonuclease P protein component
MQMKHEFRLTRSLDYKRVRRTGKSYAHPLLVLILTPAQDKLGVKIGITTGRSVGNAVERNRAKRRLRALIDDYLSTIQPGWDIIIVARQPIVKAPFESIRQALELQFKRSGVLKVADR